MRAGLAADTLLVSEAEAVYCSRPEVFDHDVGVARQPPGGFDSALLLEVQHDAALVAVHSEERRRLAAHERRAHVTGIIAAGRFLDLDYVRAHVCQEHRAKRPGEDLAAVDDLHAFQGQGHR